MKSVGKALPRACLEGVGVRAFLLHVGDPVWFPFAEVGCSPYRQSPRECPPPCSTGCVSVSDDCSYLLLACESLFLYLWTNPSFALPGFKKKKASSLEYTSLSPKADLCPAQHLLTACTGLQLLFSGHPCTAAELCCALSVRYHTSHKPLILKSSLFPCVV